MKRINYYDHLHKLAKERYNTSYIAGLTGEQRSELIVDTHKAMRERQVLINLNMNQYYAEQMYQLSNRLLDYGYTQAEIGQLTYKGLKNYIEMLGIIKK